MLYLKSSRSDKSGFGALFDAPDPAIHVEKRKQARIPFGALLENGLLQPGQILYFSKNGVRAKVLSNGHLRCGKTAGSIHAVAKMLMDNAPANGWELWFYKDGTGKKKSINELRENLRSKV
jgi:modification methylase